MIKVTYKITNNKYDIKVPYVTKSVPHSVANRTIYAEVKNKIDKSKSIIPSDKKRNLYVFFKKNLKRIRWNKNVQSMTIKMDRKSQSSVTIAYAPTINVKKRQTQDSKYFTLSYEV